MNKRQVFWLVIELTLIGAALIAATWYGQRETSSPPPKPPCMVFERTLEAHDAPYRHPVWANPYENVNGVGNGA